MRIELAKVVIAFSLVVNAPIVDAVSPWGKNYFPNTPLVTQNGETVHFFDDLISGKIVLINFIYTTCVDICPLETAQLVKVQRALGDRVGKDVFFYSITIDPEHDTPEALGEYRDRFGATWDFLTGEKQEIVKLRRKLGLYVEEIQDGSNNHNVNMIIGNQATGRWMKRSPFENPHVLADQIGNWLTDWKAPQLGDDYSQAPELRKISPGEQLFRTRCAICHSVSGEEPEGALGPDLLGVTRVREMDWLLSWLKAPDRMLEQGDPIATVLFAKYNELAMPNMRINQQEAMDLLAYIDAETRRLEPRLVQTRAEPRNVPGSTPVGEHTVGVLDAWIRATDAAAKANAGYMTLVNSSIEDVKLIQIESRDFDKVEMHLMKYSDGAMEMREESERTIPGEGIAKFAPGGWHLMMKGPHRHLQSGEKVELVLIFATGDRQSIWLEVKNI